MYVCLCMGVTDREIRDAIGEGACSTPDVMRCTGAGTRCGSCRSTIASLIESIESVESSTPVSARRSLPLLDDLDRSDAA